MGLDLGRENDFKERKSINVAVRDRNRALFHSNILSRSPSLTYSSDEILLRVGSTPGNEARFIRAS